MKPKIEIVYDHIEIRFQNNLFRIDVADWKEDTLIITKTSFQSITIRIPGSIQIEMPQSNTIYVK
jgi:hypothetical protein